MGWLGGRKQGVQDPHNEALISNGTQLLSQDVQEALTADLGAQSQLNSQIRASTEAQGMYGPHGAIALAGKDGNTGAIPNHVSGAMFHELRIMTHDTPTEALLLMMMAF